jgi:hypothetical protein
MRDRLLTELLGADVATVTIGDDVQIGPKVQLLTATRVVRSVQP